MFTHRLMVVALTLSLAVSSASAALTDEQHSCRKKVGSQSGSYLKKVVGSLTKCQLKMTSGSLPPTTDCLLEPDTADKLSAYEDALRAKITDACPDTVIAGLTFGGACNGVTNSSGLGDCLVQTHKDLAIALVDSSFGVPAVLDGDQRKCRKTAAKAGLSLLVKQQSQLRKCKDNVNIDKLPSDTVCSAFTAAAIDKAYTKLAGKIVGACPDEVTPSLSFGGTCAGIGYGGGLATCTLRSHSDGAEDVIQIEYGSAAAGGMSEAKEISSTVDCVDGPMSRCRVGDFVLRNDKIRVIIQDVQRNLFGIGQFGGQIIDADIVREVGDPDRDSFEEWSTSVNIESTAHYTSISVLNDGSDGSPAIIRTTGVDDLLDFLNPSSTVAGLGFALAASADDQDLPVQIQTDYILKPGRNYVRVETTIENIGGSPIAIFFGDFLNGSGQVEQFQPVYGFGEPLATLSCANATKPCNLTVYAGYDAAAGVSYGFFSDDPLSSSFNTSGVSVPLLGSEVLFALTGMAGPPHLIAAAGNPGDNKIFTRHFVVADGTVSAVMEARNQVQHIATGTLEGSVTAGGNPAVGAQVAVLGSTFDGPLLSPLARNVVTHTLVDAAGNYSLTVPPGEYNVVVNLEGYPYEGGGSTPLEHAVTIEMNAVSTLDMALPATGQLAVTVIDEASNPISAKVSVVGFDPSPDPRNTQNIFGLIRNTTGVFNDVSNDGLPYGLAQAHFAGPDGSIGPTPIEPGTYRVVVSHGFEYSTYAQDITVTAGNTSVINAQIARVIDSTGLVSGDFHVHSIDSADSAVSREERVISMLAEGVDFFTPSDHEFRADFTPTVTALGATSLIQTAVSAEITTFDYGHFIAWPMPIDLSLVNGGVVDHGGAAPAGLDYPVFGNYSLSPGEIVATARGDGAGTVQINHVHSFFGLGGGSGLAIDTGVTPPQSGVPAIARRLDPGITNYFPDAIDQPDAFEIWIGDDRGQVTNNFFGRNVGDWFNLLNQGIVKTGLANSDTHSRIITQSGVPRNMIASATDAPASIDPAVVSSNLNQGRTFGTNGPVVRITSSAASTGETGGLGVGESRTIATTDGAVEIELDIQSPIWAPFDRVEFYINTTTTKTTAMGQSGAGLVPVTSYKVTPDVIHNAGSEFTVNTVVDDPGIPGASHLEATVTLQLTGLTDDIWIVAIVRGTDGISTPLFPVVPNSMLPAACSNNPCRACTTNANCTGGGTCTVSNDTVAELNDGNLNQCGMMAMAFTNPLFVDVDGGGWTAPGVQVNP